MVYLNIVKIEASCRKFESFCKPEFYFWSLGGYKRKFCQLRLNGMVDHISVLINVFGVIISMIQYLLTLV